MPQLTILVMCLTLVFATPPRLQMGADRIFESEYFNWIRGKKIGLITNQTGVNSRLESVAEKLRLHDETELTALFGPEHGIFGEAQAGEKVESGPNVFSLYGATRKPTQDMLSDVDVLIYDIQDVGVRFYTFISTMLESMRAAAEKGIPFIVLDRPNPITGSRVEGPVLEKGRESFVGVHEIPVRYGMSVGELAELLRNETHLDLDLRIVPMKGWSRSEWWDDYFSTWIAPSPNMPTLYTAVVYPGLCWVEGTNLSEGRGTTRPFELVGAPWMNARELSRRLNRLGLKGVYFRPQSFTPTFSKYEGESCQGIQLHVTDRDQFKPVEAVLYLIHETLKLHPEEFEFREGSWDRLAGNSWVREMLTEGQSVKAITGRWQSGLESFKERRSRFLIYE